MNAHRAEPKALYLSSDGNQKFPQELLSLRLFKCRMWLWLGVPGLHDAEPTKLVPQQ